MNAHYLSDVERNHEPSETTSGNMYTHNRAQRLSTHIYTNKQTKTNESRRRTTDSSCCQQSFFSGLLFTRTSITRKDTSSSVCMYVSMQMCMYVYMYVSMHMCMYVCMYVYIYVYIYVCMYVCMYVSTSVCLYVWMYECMDGCVCVRARARVGVC